MAEDFSKYNGEGTILRQAQLRMLDIMIEVDKLCKKHNIPYWLEFGTLLGAVRHGGFIPWDDDFDIAVMRKDYKRLRKILKNELPENLLFQDETTDKYYYLKFGKVRDRKSYVKDPDWSDKIKEQGLFIDIFPVEKGNANIKRYLGFFYGLLFKRVRHHYKRKAEYYLSLIMWPFALLIIGFFRLVSYIIPSNQLIYSYGVLNLEKHQLTKKMIFPVKPILFEGYEFLGPADPDKLLTEIYGDYMKIPEEGNREVHATYMKIYE